ISIKYQVSSIHAQKHESQLSPIPSKVHLLNNSKTGRNHVNFFNSL
ncbi:3740_t:CDS:1, partial [Gigaspora rosea]